MGSLFTAARAINSNAVDLKNNLGDAAGEAAGAGAAFFLGPIASIISAGLLWGKKRRRRLEFDTMSELLSLPRASGVTDGDAGGGGDDISAAVAWKSTFALERRLQALEVEPAEEEKEDTAKQKIPGVRAVLHRLGKVNALIIYATGYENSTTNDTR